MVTTRPRGRSGYCGTPRRSRDTTGFGTESARVGASQLLVQRPALSKLKLLSNASAVGAAAAPAQRAAAGAAVAAQLEAFYLPHVLEAKRILYLDTDVLVQRDVVQALEAMSWEARPWPLWKIVPRNSRNT